MSDARAEPVAIRSSGRAPLRLPLASSGHRAPERQAWRVALVGVLTAVLAVVDVRQRGFWSVIAACGLVLAAWAWWVERRRAPVTPGWLVIDDEQIARVRSTARNDARGRTALGRWQEPFGVSVLANMARSRALLAFTTPSATRFLGVELATAKDADLARHLLERAVTVPDADLELAVGPAPDVLLGASGARTLLEELEQRAPESLRRLYLSDARGSAIAATPDSLVIGEGTFDLASPIEWRVFTFQEGEPGVAALYQATSIRQGTLEVVLVCRAPEELASWSVGRGSDAPPPRESRVAIDRLFMTPLRAVLEEAPRLSRPGTPPSRDRGRTAQT
jgi:hypothetical protein